MIELVMGTVLALTLATLFFGLMLLVGRMLVTRADARALAEHDRVLDSRQARLQEPPAPQAPRGS